MKRKTFFFVHLIAVLFFTVYSGETRAQVKDSFAGYTEKTPSKAMYFDWINSEWPGSTEQKVLANLEFFKWMKAQYGMQLDIYHWDAGNIDRSPSWIPEETNRSKAEKLAYGSFESPHFRKNFPNGVGPVVRSAAEMGVRFGVWLGPDGWGETESDALKRKELLLSFCRDYNFHLFKFDHAVSGIRPEKEKYLVDAMAECRKYTPDLIALNHRINLSDEARSIMTTWLWEGKETYIDVHIWNETTAPHNRAGALARGLPPSLSRLTEDHGVCISSCPDHWEDDLILQAFNRNLIMSPEIYGNPWLLRDDEYALLARIYNLHRKYNGIIVEGLVLPEEKYGVHAVSRGDEKTRLITLRNLSWNAKEFELTLTGEIGLAGNRNLLVKQLFPYERGMGVHQPGAIVRVRVDPFRSCLVLVTADTGNEWTIEGVDYRVIREVDGKPVEVELLGLPGQTGAIVLHPDSNPFRQAMIDGHLSIGLTAGERVEVTFGGTPMRKDYHRKIMDLKEPKIPKDGAALYEATCFAADNNALEVRSLRRSGPSAIAEVNAAREQFFNDPTFWTKGIWDKYAMDSNPETSFQVRNYRTKELQVKPGAFRVNFSAPVAMDRLVLKEVTDTFRIPTARVSADLKKWKTVPLQRTGNDIVLQLDKVQQIQFIIIEKTPVSVTEMEVWAKGQKVTPDEKWKISNLFPSFLEKEIKNCRTGSFVLEEVAENSCLCIAVPGKYGNEGAWAALKVDGKPVGAADRSPSFESNHWEHVVHRVDGNYTYYFPLNKTYTGKKIEAFVLGFSDAMEEVTPEVWITAYPQPYVSKKLLLSR